MIEMIGINGISGIVVLVSCFGVIGMSKRLIDVWNNEIDDWWNEEHKRNLKKVKL